MRFSNMETNAFNSYFAQSIQDCKSVVISRDHEDKETRRALNIVRQFGIKHNMVLFGGLAIHLALQACGFRAGLYSEDELPDYDWLTPDSVRLAQILADELRDAKLPAVSAIRAIHVQTMRVRTDFRYVADIGHVNQNIFRLIPRLTLADGLQIVHPDYQRLDMHLAFCFPYSNAPREDVFNRWSKDAARLSLLDQYYPIELPSNVVPPKMGKWSEWVPVTDQVVGALPEELTVAITGLAAYAMFWGALRALNRDAVKNLPEVRVEFKKNAVRVSHVLPDVPPLAAQTSVAVGGGHPCDPFMDYGTLVRGADGKAICQVLGSRRLAVTTCRVTEQLDSAAPSLGVRVASMHHVLLTFLLASFGGCQVSRAFYVWTKQLIDIGHKLLPAEAAREAGATNMFVAPVDVLSGQQLDASYVIRINSLAERSGDKYPYGDASFPLITDPVPANYYCGKKKQEFDYASSAYFRRDGCFGAEPEVTAEQPA